MKAVMSNQRIPFFHKIRSAWDIYCAHKSGVLGNIDSVLCDHKELCGIIEEYVGISVVEATVLDLGCGQRANQTVLFKADGADVVGVDYETPTYNMGLTKFFGVAKKYGIERAVKALFRHILLDKDFYKRLSSGYGKTIPLDTLDIRIMDAANLDFPDEKFDFIHSAWMFEHVEDVPNAIREINRVLKYGGVAWIGVHLFPSLSGGHNFNWARPDEAPSKRVPAWDHLRDLTSPVNTYLNKLRLQDYRDIFSQHVQIIDEKLTCEGEKLLTPELEQILVDKGHSREDLLTRTVVFVCRKQDMAKKQTVVSN